MSIVNLEFYKKKMRYLIEIARSCNPDYPFAAMVVDMRTQSELSIGVNDVKNSPIMHGEIVAINSCAQKYGKDHVPWSHCALISTAEPCPMCQGAIIWSGISKVVFGTSIETLIEKKWNQINMKASSLSDLANFKCPEVVGPVLASETDSLFKNL